MIRRSIAYGTTAAVFILMGLLPTCLHAQDGEALFRAWMTSQRETILGVSSVSMDERIVLSVDGGFGRQTLQVEARRTAGPGANPPGREVLHTELNGREIPAERGERFRRQQRGLWRPEMGRLLESFRFPLQDISRMRLSQSIVQEQVSGRTAWRVDMQPQSLPNPIERMTAWFDLAEFRLLESLAILRAPGANAIQVRTSYDRIDGIDLPVHISIEGSSRIQRRMRFFTTVFEIDTRYSDFSISFDRP